MGATLARFQQFILAGHDYIALSIERARERGLPVFLSWRMNESYAETKTA